MKQIQAPVLRWPGGCFAETYDWRDGIGENRPVRPNWWTEKDGRYEPNSVGTHEFVDLCELIGAKPYFAVNVTSITPLHARDWMDYCLSPRGTTTLALEREKNGHPEPFDIPYWGIGNENWGGGGNMTPDYYALEYRRFATILKNVPSAPKDLIAGGANGGDYNWTRRLTDSMQGIRRILGGMSFHFYCGKAGDCVDFSTEQWYELLEKAHRMDELITRHHGILQGYKMENEMKLVIDEWGCWHPDGSGPSKGYNLFEQQSTMRDAVISAITLNIFNNQCDKIKMANVAQLVNNLHCLFLASGENCIETPTFHVFDMFKTHQNGTAIKTVAEDNGALDARVSVSASVKDGIMTVTMANCNCSEDAEVSLNLLGGSYAGKATVTTLKGEAMNSHNTFENPNAVAPTEVSDVALDSAITVPAAGVVSVRVAIA
jgi:alpha-N-arabinofuranosidase